MIQPIHTTVGPLRQPGPVTLAIRAMRSEPEPVELHDPISALRAALERAFFEAGTPIDFGAEISAPNQGGKP